MKVFVVSLEKEIDKRINKSELSNLNVLKKSLEASLVLGDAFQRLRELSPTIHSAPKPRK